MHLILITECFKSQAKKYRFIIPEIYNVCNFSVISTSAFGKMVLTAVAGDNFEVLHTLRNYFQSISAD